MRTRPTDSPAPFCCRGSEFPKRQRLDWSELPEMKARWRVSLQTIIRRAYDLGIIGAVRYRNANVYISRNGWKTSEPGEESIPVESPEIVPTGFQLLAENGTYPEDVAHELHITVSIIEKSQYLCRNQCKPRKHHGPFLQRRLYSQFRACRSQRACRRLPVAGCVDKFPHTHRGSDRCFKPFVSFSSRT